MQVSAGRAAAWGGTERWLSLEEFSNQLHRPPFHVLLGCDSWQVWRVLATPGLLRPCRTLNQMLQRSAVDLHLLLSFRASFRCRDARGMFCRHVIMEEAATVYLRLLRRRCRP